jgi:hypothetical protein
MGLVIAIAYSLSVAQADAQSVKTCVGAEVLSIKESPESRYSDDQTKTIEVTASESTEKAVTIVARGPVLGSMDWSVVETNLACTQHGILLTANITRSAGFTGSTLKNTPWIPRINVVVMLRQPDMLFEVRWRMRLTTGEELTPAQPPAYPEQIYPITMAKIITRPQ